MGSLEQERLKEIFAEALELSGADRATYLDRACAGDVAMRAEVDAYLLAANSSGALMGNADEDISGPLLLAERPGASVGRYKLLEQIGEGGFGVVFMAAQERPVRRTVALKIIKLGMDTRQVVARFEAERQALAMMDHPNIAKVFDAGSTDTGRPYFVMELVKGIPITNYCDQNKLTTRDRLELFISVCSAVQHAHQKGIIHRDLKPNNVMVTLHDDKPVVKIIDFGVAKATQSKLTERTLFTGFRQMIGTPAYMSPEQAQMSGLDVDTRSDVYSLGVLLYELLTGTTPFDTKQLMTAAYDEMQRIIREVDPPAPSTRLSTLDANTLGTVAQQRQNDPKRLAQSLKGDLDWIVMRCLEKDRTRRYPTANALAAEVERYLSDEPVLARRPTRIYRMRKFARRNKVGVIAGSIVALALIVGFGVATWMYLRERQASSRAVAAEQIQIQLRRQAEVDQTKARTEAAKSQQVAQLLKDMLGGIDPYVAVGRDTALLRDILDKTAERVENDLKDQPEVQAELLETIGYAYNQIGPLERAEALERTVLAIRRALPGDHRLEVASSLHYLGLVLWRQDRRADAEVVLRESLAIRRELMAGTNWNLPDTLLALGGVLTFSGGVVEAEALQREAVQLRRIHKEDSELAHSLSLLGQTLDEEGKVLESESTLREAVGIARKTYGSGHPVLAEALRLLGSSLHHAGKLTEAESVLSEALEMDRKVSDKDRSLDLAWTLFEFALVRAEQGRLVEAEEMLREALPVQIRVLGHAHSSTSMTLAALADVLRREGKLDEAEKFMQESRPTTTLPATTRP